MSETEQTIAPPNRCRVCQCDLVVGKNWSENRQKARHYICNPCYSKQQRAYREGTIHTIERAKAAKELKAQKIDELSEYWNDQDLNTMEPAERLIYIFDREDVREPSKGYARDEMLEVFHPDDLVFDIAALTEDYLKTTKLRGYDKTTVKYHLLEVLKEFSDDIREGKKQSAYFKLLALVQRANQLYPGQEEIVAEPPYNNTKTGSREHRYYLLTHRREKEGRDRIRDKTKRGLDNSSEREENLVQRKESQGLQKKENPSTSDSQKETESSEGGENKENGKQE